MISLRFKISLAVACTASGILFLCCFVMITLVREKQITDLSNHSKNLAHQITSSPFMRKYLEEQPGAPQDKEIELWLQNLLESNPYVEEITLLDQFGKMPFRVEQSKSETNTPLSPRASMSLHDVLSSGEPSLVESSWEYFVPLSIHPNTYWGVLRLHWKGEATWEYFHTLKQVTLYTSTVGFLLAWFLTFFVFLRAYDYEQSRMIKILSQVVNGDYALRIDPQTLTRGLAEIGTYINRILGEIDEEKKRSDYLDMKLRETEKGFLDSRKALGDKSDEVEALRQDMCNGLLRLFDRIWCGVLVIDDEYRIIFMNEPASRLLRFARCEEETIVDERLRKCLAPLIRLKKEEQVDDLCIWPQTTLGRAVACRVRATTVSSGGSEHIYFVLLKEENGYPRQHSSIYFSERLIFDILNPKWGVLPLSDYIAENSHTDSNGWIIHLYHVLQRLDRLRSIERGDLGHVVALRLIPWLRDLFSTDESRGMLLNFVSDAPEVDIPLSIPEQLLLDLLDTMVELIRQFCGTNSVPSKEWIILRASVDARGRPVLIFTIRNLSRKEAVHLQDILEERVELTKDGLGSDSLGLTSMMGDIRVSILQCIKKILRIRMELVYSDSKHLATYRLTIDNHQFPEEVSEPVSTSEDPVRNLVRDYLNQG